MDRYRTYWTVGFRFEEEAAAIFSINRRNLSPRSRRPKIYRYSEALKLICGGDKNGGGSSSRSNPLYIVNNRVRIK